MFYWGAGQSNESNDLQTAYHVCADFHFLFVVRILLCPKVSSIKLFSEFQTCWKQRHFSIGISKDYYNLLSLDKDRLRRKFFKIKQPCAIQVVLLNVHVRNYIQYYVLCALYISIKIVCRSFENTSVLWNNDLAITTVWMVKLRLHLRFIAKTMCCHKKYNRYVQI